MFEGLIDQVAGRFGIGPDKVKQLVAMVSALMFNQPGGLAGFLDRFKQNGLGEMVQSWVGTGPNQPIAPNQVEQVLGGSAIGDMAGKLGLDSGTVTNALSSLLPNMVNGVTEGGQIPASIPAALTGLLGGGAAAANRVVSDARGGMGRWLPWIGLLLLLLIAFLAFRSCSKEAAVTGTPSALELPDASKALDALIGRTFTADDLVKALNLMDVHFDTGSARISADSTAILAKAASVIKSAPAGTRIEVGGHTDNTGDAAANMTLSRERAAAVMAELVRNGVEPSMLTSQGYGQERPVADNSTDAGRAKNRRMEFTVLR